MKKDSSSSKKPKPPPARPVGGKAKPSVKRKKMESEIDKTTPTGPVGGKGKPSSVKQKKMECEIDKTTPTGPVGGKGKPSSVKRKKIGSEIDEIFAAKKRTKPEENNDKPSRTSSAAVKSDKRTVVKGSKGRVARRERDFSQDSGPSQRKKTADGLTVYTEEELGLRKSDAGGTRLCPFDCDCCF